MTSTVKILIAIIIIAAIGFIVYKMPKDQGSDTYGPGESMNETELPSATGSADDVVSALIIDADAESGIATNENDSDLVTTDSQALIEVSNAYADNQF